MKHRWNEFKYSDYHEIISWEVRYAIRRYNENWESLLCREENERQRYGVEVEQHRLTVIILTCIWIESVINFFLCTKCTTEDFELIDKYRISLIDKWTVVPKRLVSNHSFDRHPELKQELSQLIRRRNRIVHPKPMMSFDGDNRHKGNEPNFVLGEHAFMETCASLPFRLVEHLLSFDQEAYIEMSEIHRLCGSIAGEFRTNQYYIKRCSNVPEELVKEIMAQGYDRHTAKRYAVFIGDSPLRDRELHIVVKRFRERIAVLKPLNFFAHQKRILFVDGGAADVSAHP